MILSLVEREEHLACPSAERKLRKPPELVGYRVGCIERKLASMKRLGNCHQHYLVELLARHAHGSRQRVNLTERKILLSVTAHDDFGDGSVHTWPNLLL